MGTCTGPACWAPGRGPVPEMETEEVFLPWWCWHLRKRVWREEFSDPVAICPVKGRTLTSERQREKARCFISRWKEQWGERKLRWAEPAVLTPRLCLCRRGSFLQPGHSVPRPSVLPFLWQKDVKSYFIRCQPPARGFLRAWWKAWNNHLKDHSLTCAGWGSSSLQESPSVAWTGLWRFFFFYFKANFKNQVIVSQNLQVKQKINK